jgi:hypothetical protein
MKNFTKELLYDLYVIQKLNPYEIGKKLLCNHKTVRSYLKKHKIPLRTASEYNYINRSSHINPNRKVLENPKTIAAHIAYLCEGWHTEKSNCWYFCNTDTQLIDLVVSDLRQTYKAKTIRFVICTSNMDNTATILLLEKYPNAKVYLEESRITPIVRVYSGGKTLVRDYVQNAYNILSSLS